MSLDVTHWLRGYMYDADGNPVSGATVTAESVTGTESGTVSTTTTATGYYQLNVMHITNEGDLVNVNFDDGRNIVSDEFIKIKLDDLTQVVSTTLQYCFKLVGDSYTIYIRFPDYRDSDMKLNKEVKLTNFWTDQIYVDDIGKQDEPLMLTVHEVVDVRTRDTISGLIEAIHLISNDGEECTITTINDCIDGVFVISRFHAESIRKTTQAFILSLTLQYVRDD